MRLGLHKTLLLTLPFWIRVCIPLKRAAASNTKGQENNPPTLPPAETQRPLQTEGVPTNKHTCDNPLIDFLLVLSAARAEYRTWTTLHYLLPKDGRLLYQPLSEPTAKKERPLLRSPHAAQPLSWRLNSFQRIKDHKCTKTGTGIVPTRWPVQVASHGVRLMCKSVRFRRTSQAHEHVHTPSA